MNTRQVWGLAGGFFFVYILITLTNKPAASPRRDASEPRATTAAAVAPEDAAASPAPQATGDARIRGFTLLPPDGRQFGGDALKASIADIARQGAGWVAIQPPINQPTGKSAEVPADPASSLVLEDVRSGVKAAREAGIKVMLRPQLVAGDGTPREQLQPPDVEAWLTSYGKALQPYLAMAESEKIEVVCLGSRLAATQQAEGWKPLIEEARKAYAGKLTYAASHDPEAGYRKVTFWPLLDYVGIDAFFPLADVGSPQVRHLSEGWKLASESLESWRGTAGLDKPVLFTSAGFPRLVGAAADPGHPDNRAPEDEKLQAAAYEAFFQVMWAKPWLAGVFWHTWTGGPDAHDPYALAGRPALDVVRTHFTGAAAGAGGDD